MAAVGVFGKLPQRGDFIAHGLPSSFSDPWHAWLSAGLVASRALLGQRFIETFLEAPIWRFALQPGRCGPAAAAGILMPSVDSAERLFPLALAAMTEEALDLAALGEAEGWFDALEAHARAVLEHGAALPDWLAAIDRLPSLPEAISSSRAGWAPVAGTGEAGAVSEALRRRGQRDACLFWGQGSPHVRPALFLDDRLPEDADFARLLADPSAGCAAGAAA